MILLALLSRPETGLLTCHLLDNLFLNPIHSFTSQPSWLSFILDAFPEIMLQWIISDCIFFFLALDFHGIYKICPWELQEEKCDSQTRVAFSSTYSLLGHRLLPLGPAALLASLLSANLSSNICFLVDYLCDYLH